MPGFKIAGQGTGPNATAEMRRTHRWEFQTIGGGTLAQVRLLLKTASRPSFALEEAQMHHNQEQVYYAGKQTWEPLALSWYDAEQDPDVSQSMWDWINKCADIKNANVNPPSAYKADEARLQMLDGVGTATETWTMYNGWPQQSNWGGLDYSSNEIQLIEIKFRFDRAIRTA